MAIGRTFCESLQKALRSLEQGRLGLNARPGARPRSTRVDDEELLDRAGGRHPRAALRGRGGAAPGRLGRDGGRAPAGIDPWFLAPDGPDQRRPASTSEPRRAPRRRGRALALAGPGPAGARLKRLGFSDAQLGLPALGTDEAVGPAGPPGRRGRRPPSRPSTPARPSSRPTRRTTTRPTRTRRRCARATRPRVIILGSGPNRIGQGIEFDYCCVHASIALREAGYETVMVNCNPETVSTDYDTSDRLYFEPLTTEDVAQRDRRRDPGQPGRRAGGRRDRLARRPDPAQAGRRARSAELVLGTARRSRSTWPRTASAGTRCATGSASPSRRAAPPTSVDEALAVARPRSATRCSCARATCSAAGPWRSSTTTTACAG